MHNGETDLAECLDEQREVSEGGWLVGEEAFHELPDVDRLGVELQQAIGVALLGRRKEDLVGGGSVKDQPAVSGVFDAEGAVVR